jgi:hypothetical protein
MSILGLLVLFGNVWQRTRLHLLPVWTVSVLRKRNLSVPYWLERWAWRAQLTNMEWMYLQISWMLDLLGTPVITGQTPSERSEIFAHTLPSGKGSIQTFLGEYLKAEYSPHMVDESKAQLANRELWKRVLSTWFNRVTGL